MSAFEKKFPEQEISSIIPVNIEYTKHRYRREGWLEALKWVEENNDGCYCEDNISHVYKEIAELEKEK